ncbi:MAG TPA: hypothetical protein VGY94_01075 [Acidobacteriaceae bacterium]|jgi:hypothetical protein|nr:hypothetical protein [Acidobacteriaceae bacterium]
MLRSQTRREFLRLAAGTVAATAVSTLVPSAFAAGTRLQPRTVVVTFGGGARDEETFAVEGQQNIPHLLNELIPQGTFFTQVVNRGILGHYVATAGIVTGCYETFNNFIAQPTGNPTVFEYFRRGLGRPMDDAWVIAPSNGFQQIGFSRHGGYQGQGAGVILPKQLLAAAVSRQRPQSLVDYEHLLQDNYEMPVYRPSLSESDGELHLEQLASTLRLSVEDFTRDARALDSADALSLSIARRLMAQVSPSLLLITLHDMDVAHAGAFSLYVDAIQRADRICGELWTTIQTMPEYKDRTALFIMPDFGRDADGDPGGNGFQHHRTGGAMARTTWLLALGPGIRQNVTVDRAIQPIDLVPTIGKRHGFETPYVNGAPIAELV